MSDSDIIKAFEWCTGGTSQPCRECPLENEAFCKDKLEEGILDLINRQKTEIERLEVELKVMRGAANSYKMHHKSAKTEAVKEFAERLHEKLFAVPTIYNSHFGRMVDNLVKEMTEDENDGT